MSFDFTFDSLAGYRFLILNVSLRTLKELLLKVCCHSDLITLLGNLSSLYFQDLIFTLEFEVSLKFV